MERGDVDILDYQNSHRFEGKQNFMSTLHLEFVRLGDYDCLIPKLFRYIFFNEACVN